MRLEDLPSLNACLNATAAVLMTIGWVLAKRGQYRAHGWLMGACFLVSTVFLVSYLTYHYQVGHTTYEGVGLVRLVYFVVLITHIVLAGLVVPLVLRTLYLAARRRWEKHRWWGRITLPIWLYVSVTGVVVYLMLYGF